MSVAMSVNGLFERLKNAERLDLTGVNDGARTRDNRNHN